MVAGEGPSVEAGGIKKYAFDTIILRFGTGKTTVFSVYNDTQSRPKGIGITRISFKSVLRVDD